MPWRFVGRWCGSEGPNSVRNSATRVAIAGGERVVQQHMTGPSPAVSAYVRPAAVGPSCCIRDPCLCLLDDTKPRWGGVLVCLMAGACLT